MDPSYSLGLKYENKIIKMKSVDFPGRNRVYMYIKI